MNPSRRGFLGALFGAAAIAATKDPEELLFRPGAKLISIPGPKIVEPTIAERDDVFRVGDIFTIAGYMAINPLTLLASDQPQRFVVTAVTPSGPIFAPQLQPIAPAESSI